MTTAESFVQLLRDLPVLPEVFNPWRDFDAEHDIDDRAPQIRSRQLTEYLQRRARRAKVILVAEAPGYQGCKFSGIAMTSERILLGHLKEVPAHVGFGRLGEQTSRPERLPKGAAEPTATIAWKQMLQLGFKPEEFVFWNAFPCHPRKPGQPLTNRKPTTAELQAAAHALPAMLELFPRAEVVAVGNVAQGALALLGVHAPNVRHPANGGATKFRTQIGEIAELAIP